MKPVAIVLLMIAVAVVLTACGEADAGTVATATPAYGVLSLDGSTPSADGAVEPAVTEEMASSAEPNGVTPSPEPTNVAAPVTTETFTSTSTPEPTIPTATLVVTDHGVVANGMWELALLTVADLPADREFASQALEPMIADQSVVCGISDPTDSAAYQNASNGALFVDPTAMVFIQQMITEFTTPQAARQMLGDLQMYFEALRTCEDPGEVAVDPPSDLERLQNMEITPIDLPAVGDDRIGYRMTFKSEIPQPQPALDAEVIAIRVDHILVVIGSGNWEDELPPVDATLIERAVEKVELALADPPVPAEPTAEATPTIEAEVDVSTITTCEQAAEETLTRIQAVLDIVAPYGFDELSGDEAPPGVDELGREVSEIEQRARAIGCEAAEYGALVANGIEPLEWSGSTAQLFAEALRAEYLEFTYSEVTAFE